MTSFPAPSAKFVNEHRAFIQSKEAIDAAQTALRNVSSPGYYESYIAKRKADITSNENVGPRRSHESFVAEAQTAYFSAVEAYEVQKEKFAEASKKEQDRVRKEVQPAIEADEKIVAQCVAQAIPAFRRIEQTAAKLAGLNYGFWPPCRLEIDRVFKDSPFDKGSDMMSFLRQAASLGYIKLPEGV
ncbi:hypothetical protein [Bradyrhizobium sp. Gha]|uniref:hypothetical protein n=1 Tax=Bradyrhizobium sp. Gha TaxID=1855318 RepID=UPI0008F0D0CC|nr:hypothetical protein [Bradyrhizobium sp. Gha]SFI32744.1 hypothetical protein SAMN05216525_107128 [Bradyrhizobium sp. Gha]